MHIHVLIPICTHARIRTHTHMHTTMHTCIHSVTHTYKSIRARKQHEELMGLKLLGGGVSVCLFAVVMSENVKIERE